MAYNQKSNPFLKRSPVRQSEIYSVRKKKQKKQGILPEIFGGVNVRGQYRVKRKLKNWEKKINILLGKPMKTARKVSKQYYGIPEEGSRMSPHPQQSDVDQMRHALAGAYTAKKVGIIGANILGLAHEMISPNVAGEHRSDLINNAIGSIIGSVVPKNKIEKTIQWLSAKGWLHEYKKQDK